MPKQNRIIIQYRMLLMYIIIPEGLDTTVQLTLEMRSLQLHLRKKIEIKRHSRHRLVDMNGVYYRWE